MVPILNIPILSVVFMMLAGILIGHLIWYRDRSDDEAALLGLRGMNSDLQAALHDHKKACAALESELESQRKEWDRLKDMNKELEHSRQETDHERALLSAELARLQQLKDQAFHDLDQERQQRRSFQEALARAEEQTSQLRVATEQLQRQVAAFQAERDELDQAAQAKLQQQDVTVEQLTMECTAARQELDEHRDLLERVQAELQAREEDLRSLCEERDELSIQVEDQRAAYEQLQRKISQLDQLVTQRDEAMSRATSAEQKNQYLQEQLASRQQTNKYLSDEHAELVESHASLRREFMAQSEEHQAASSTLIEARRRLADMEAEVARMSVISHECDEARQRERACNEVIVRLKSDASARQGELDALRCDLEETAARLRNERQQREDLQSVLLERDAEIESLSSSRKEVQSLGQELAAARQSMAEQQQAARSLAAQLEAANEEIANQKRALADRQRSADELSTQNRHLREQAQALGALRGEHESVKRMLEDKSRELNDLLEQQEASLAASIRSAATLSALQEKVELLESAHAQQGRELFDWRTRFAEHAERLQLVTAERDEYRESCAAAENRIQQLESKARASEETIRHLRRERGAVLTRARVPAAAASSGHAAESSDAEVTGGRMRRDELLGMVYTQPPKRKDDLKKITGIAQVIEKKLNAFGVYTYRQIMEWDSVAVQEFSKLLSFRDRIQRDGWISQARDLYHEYYGRSAA